MTLKRAGMLAAIALAPAAAVLSAWSPPAGADELSDAAAKADEIVKGAKRPEASAVDAVELDDEGRPVRVASRGMPACGFAALSRAGTLLETVKDHAGSPFRARPEACANCHMMREKYDGWTRSVHHAAAGCGDCHLPRNGADRVLRELFDSFRHSLAFATDRFSRPIRISPSGVRILEGNCRACHPGVVPTLEGPHKNVGRISCVRCHASAGHPAPKKQR